MEVRVDDNGGGRRETNPAAAVESVALVLTDEPLRMAIQGLVVQSGMRVVANPAAATYTVCDQLDSGLSRADVLLVAPTPVGALTGIAAVIVGWAGALLSRADPSCLPFAFEALRRSTSVIPSALLNLRAHMPTLTPRHHRLLAFVAERYVKDPVLADQLGVSIPTLKRDLRELTSLLGCAGRRELPAVARALGYTSQLGERELDLFCSPPWVRPPTGIMS